MTDSLATAILSQLDELVSTYEGLAARYKNDWTDISIDQAHEFLASAQSAIVRAAGTQSTHASQTAEILKYHKVDWAYAAVQPIAGIVRALRHDVEAGYLTSIRELVHATLFSDFFEMADYLLKESYKDPAAVLVGGILEEHLRLLCEKYGIETEELDSRGASRPKKADRLNADLAKAGVYTKLDHKNVTGWLELRNLAAHGHYDEYTKEQVELLLRGVTDFSARCPA